MKSQIFSLLFCLAVSASAAELYVSPSGNDKNNGSAKAPFATIARAAKAANPGDTVKIAPGIYREQVAFRKSGTKQAPITFAGTRGKNGEFLTIVEPTGTPLEKWVPAPEVAPDVWKTPLKRRPNLVIMNGAMIAYINRLTMALPSRGITPKEINEEMLWDHFGPNCKRLSGFDLMKLPADIKVGHQYFHKRKELFWPVISNIISGWKDGWLYVRFADGSKPQGRAFTATFGDGFTLNNVSYLNFKNFHVRGSRIQFRITGKSSHNTIEKCLLMHGGVRVLIEGNASDNTVRDSILTAGFIRSDLFKLRSQEDMRGGLLYLIFKYIIGTSSSDDVGVRTYGKNTKVLDNVIIQGLIGVSTNAPGMEVAGNVVREMSSVGILTVSGTVGKFHHNIITNCGIPLRIHHLRHKRLKREEYHYNNLFVQARHGGTQVFIHSTSFYKTDDAVNFDKKLDKRKRVAYVYKQNPPAPVDAGKIHIYHNTFWGGHDLTPFFNVTYLQKRFRMTMPFFVVNNICKDSFRLDTQSHELAVPNLLYTFSKDLTAAERRDADVPKFNKVVPAAQVKTIWNMKDTPGLPDISLAEGSPALAAGVDVSRPFTVRGKKYPALPGFAPGYFKGKAPAAGALQQGESQEKFVSMHRKAEAALKLIKSK